MSEQVTKYQKLFEQDRKTLVIMGDVGVGKTHMAKFHTPIEHDFFIDDPTFKQLLGSFGLNIRKPEDYACDIKLYPMEMLSKKKLVIFDDFGSTNPTEAYIEKMLYWINKRAERPECRTIITTNLTLDEFQKYEKRIVSRLLQDAVVLTLIGEDRRKKTTKYVNI